MGGREGGREGGRLQAPSPCGIVPRADIRTCERLLLRFTCPCMPAVEFSAELETAWLLASLMGFAMDTIVYHTFSLLVASIVKLLVRALVLACFLPPVQ